MLTIQSNLKIFKQKSTYLDVMSLKDSFQIMVTNWDDIFSKYFGCSSVDKWKIKFDACAKARNPVAHGHEEFLSDEERKTTEGYCIEILDRLSGYVSNDIDKVEKQLSDLISGSENQSSITGLVDPVESLLNTFVKMKIMEVGGKNHNNLRGIIEKKYGAIIPKNYLSGVDLYSMLEREVEVQVVKINNGMYEVAYYSN